jgi:hypothetical protein
MKKEFEIQELKRSTTIKDCIHSGNSSNESSLSESEWQYKKPDPNRNTDFVSHMFDDTPPPN